MNGDERTTQAEDGTEILEASGRSSALEALNRSEIDIQISTAHRFPRNVSKCIDEATSMATLTPEVAESMIYSLPRAGKNIEGPSVRLAEAVGSSWGNLRYSARIISIEDAFIVAQGACHDLEKNIAASVEVRRRITDKNGKRYKEDMIVVTGNAACSIALRNAIFKVVPFALARQVYDSAKKVAVGDAASLGDRRQKAIDYFTSKLGVPLDRVLGAIGRLSVDQVTLEDLTTLTGLKTAIKEGDTTIDQAFPSAESEKPSVAEKLKDLAEKKGEETINKTTGEVTTAPAAQTKSADPDPGEQQTLALCDALASKADMTQTEALKELKRVTSGLYGAKSLADLTADQVKDIHSKIANGDFTKKK